MAVSIADQFEILPTIPRRTVYVLPVFDYYINVQAIDFLRKGSYAPAI
jgi:hypothetical protein